MKFSIVVPVYNVENYIVKCLDSIFHQSYSNYEVIIVNDGSPDQSEKIIRDYIKGKKNFKLYSKENGGLSDARNFGVTKATGDYLLFVDSDDYIAEDLLQRIYDTVQENQFDVVRYGLDLVDDDGSKLLKSVENVKAGRDKVESIRHILQSEYVEPAWLYAYRLDFWKQNHFLYAYGRIHEDFGLTPLVLYCANDIGFVDYVGYHYVQRENSIMRQVNYEKLKKRTIDFQEQYLELKKKIDTSTKDGKLLMGFASEAVLYKGRELIGEDRKAYASFIRKENIIGMMNIFRFKNILQKIYLSFFLERYLQKISEQFYSELECEK